MIRVANLTHSNLILVFLWGGFTWQAIAAITRPEIADIVWLALAIIGTAGFLLTRKGTR
jgi:hypothetical protein